MYEKLKNKMQAEHLTTNRLAKQSNITPQDLYAALKGRKPMFPKWKARIAAALNVDEKDLFNEEAEGGSDGTI